MSLIQIGRELMGFCYPGACPRCGAISSGKFCDDCEAAMQLLLDRPRCAYCARPVHLSGADCPWCRGRGIYPFTRIATLGVFQEPLKELIHSMKYRRRWSLAEQLADRLLERDEVIQMLHDADMLIPVPLWRWRQVHRGYNQSDVIARQLAKAFSIKVKQAVARIRPTASQTELKSRQGRVENVRDAFKLRSPDVVAGKRIVVVDDVMTSAATLKEVGRVLRQAQPAQLCAITLAVADPRGRGFEAI